MITILFRVLLPQLIVRWLPIVLAFVFGVSVAISAGRTIQANGVSSTVAAIIALVLFTFVMILSEVFQGSIFQRLTQTRSSEEFFLKLRENHRVNLSPKSNFWLLCIGHIFVGICMLTVVLVLLG